MSAEMIADDHEHMTPPCFALGDVVATPGAIHALDRAGVSIWSLLGRHRAGDWGALDAEDQRANWTALSYGLRLLSSYPLVTGERIWIITEADRSSTCLLRPEEY
jgi:hypothetical protein